MGMKPKDHLLNQAEEEIKLHSPGHILLHHLVPNGRQLPSFTVYTPYSTAISAMYNILTKDVSTMDGIDGNRSEISSDTHNSQPVEHVAGWHSCHYDRHRLWCL